MDFLIRVAVLLVFWGPHSALSVSCESSGVCQHTQGGCRSDARNTCYGQTSREQDHYGYNLAGSRIDTECREPSKHFNVKLENLNLTYIHVDPDHVKVCVSWTVTNRNQNNTLGQYVFKLYYSNKVLRPSFCVSSSQMQVCLNNFKYSNLQNQPYKIEIYPNVLASDDVIDNFNLQAQLSTINGCGDIRVKNKSSVCVNRFRGPRKMSLKSTICNNTKTLNISWDHPENALVPPEKYYVRVYRKPDVQQYFEVINATDLIVTNLNASINYSAKVVAYRKCSGLGTYDSVVLGCGIHKIIKQENFNDNNKSCFADSTEGESLIASEHLSISFASESAAHSFSAMKISIFSITGGILVIIVVVILAVVIFRLLALKLKSLQKPVHPIQNNFSLFLFYAPSMSQEKQERLNNQVAANLAKYFSIVTTGELMDGDVSKWLERTVNSVDVVLIVANEDFSKDWQSSTRHPQLSCLESLISAAVVQNTVSKFAFISTENCMDNVHIPENLYLKLLRVFLMGSKTNHEVELYQFVTKSRMIVLETECLKNMQNDDKKIEFCNAV